MKRVTREEFIEKARKVHGDKYDYSKVEWVNTTTKICIICPEHGDFWQTPNNHLHGSRCPICSKESSKKKRSINKEEFIRYSNEIHHNKYDYSKVEWVNTTTKVCIICPEHGEFWQRPVNHLKGYGCKKCATQKAIDALTSNTSEFIQKAKKLYGDKYDYSKVDYKRSNIPVIIICPEHGEFKMTPNDFLDGHHCPLCANKTRADKLSTVTQEEFLKRAKIIHGNKYIYDEAIYHRWDEKVKIICPKHGEFWQTPHMHIGNKNGCPECKNEHASLRSRLTREEFIEKARKVHGDKYDYSKVVYNTGYDKVCIICPKHGEFWQIAQDHLNGHGCRKCQRSLLEEEIISLLNERDIPYIYDKPYKFLNGLKLDFYFPDKKLAIECQGEQHFRPVCFGGIPLEKAEKNFSIQWERDMKKAKLCKDNGINLIYYSNKDDIYPYRVITDINKILDVILNA